MTGASGRHTATVTEQREDATAADEESTGQGQAAAGADRSAESGTQPLIWPDVFVFKSQIVAKCVCVQISDYGQMCLCSDLRSMTRCVCVQISYHGQVCSCSDLRAITWRVCILYLRLWPDVFVFRSQTLTRFVCVQISDNNQMCLCSDLRQ